MGEWLCRGCGESFSGRERACPRCGSAQTFAAAECAVCGEVREAAEAVCDRCAREAERLFFAALAPLHPAQAAHLDRLVEGRSLLDWRRGEAYE